MSLSQIDPLIGTEIMELLGVPPYALDDPKQFKQVHEIVSYFQGRPDYRHRLLSLVQKRPKSDKLDTVWTWLQLQKEREDKIASLNPNLFAPDIAEEIVNGYLTKDAIKRVRENLAEQKRQARAAAQAREADKQLQVAQESKVAEIVEPNVYGNVLLTLDEIEDLSNTISNYED